MNPGSSSPNIQDAGRSQPLLPSAFPDATIEISPSDLSTDQLLEHLNAIIEQVKNSDRDRSPNATSELEDKPPTYALIITTVLLSGRAISCTYRYVTTKDGLEFIFQEKFVNSGNKKWSILFTKVGATLFCVTDAIITIISSKNSVSELYRIRSAVSKSLNLLRDENGSLPLCQLFLLPVLLGGGMMGTWFKANVGVLTVAREIVSLITANPSEFLDSILTTFSAVVGSCSALCFLAFQSKQALHQLRIKQALDKSPYWIEYKKREYVHIFLNQFVTFLISLAMTLITVMATFYQKGNFDIDAKTASKALVIAFSNMILNTWFTTGPNFLYKTIQANYKATVNNNGDAYHGNRIGIFLIQCFGFISSTGNSLAVFPAIVHVLLQISKKENIADESLGYSIAAIVITALLAVPMFLRDYAYYTKLVLELLFPKPIPSPEATVNPLPLTRAPSTSGYWARFTSWICPSSPSVNEAVLSAPRVLALR